MVLLFVWLQLSFVLGGTRPHPTTKCYQWHISTLRRERARARTHTHTHTHARTHARKHTHKPGNMHIQAHRTHASCTQARTQLEQTASYRLQRTTFNRLRLSSSPFCKSTYFNLAQLQNKRGRPRNHTFLTDIGYNYNFFNFFFIIVIGNVKFLGACTKMVTPHEFCKSLQFLYIYSFLFLLFFFFLWHIKR